MVNPKNLGKLDGAIRDGEAILIADNARESRYNIGNLEQIFSVGHGAVREGIGNRFDMTINEPNGVTLLSAIKAASQQLGIGSHIRAGYIIAIEFNGRDADGVARKFNQIFYYPASIRGFDFKVTNEGAAYHINLIENSASGYTYLNNVVKDQLTVVAQTVGEFVDIFESKINEAARRIWALDPGSSYPDVYEFKFDDTTESWRDWRFQILDDPFAVNGNNFVSLVENGDPFLQVIINNGSNITSIFSQVLQLTAEYKRILVLQQGSGTTFMRETPSSDTDVGTDALPVFFKAITNVEYDRYDILKGAYEKKIIFKIKAYTVSDEIISPTSYMQSITNPGIQASRINNLVANDFLRKRYDYYYTGNNTEVLELDLNFNWAYFQVTAHGGGAYGDVDLQSPQNLQDAEEVIGRLAAQKGQIAQQTATINRISTDADTQVDPGLQTALRRQRDQGIINFDATLNVNLQVLQDTYNLNGDSIDHPVRFATDVISDQDVLTSDNDRIGGALQFGAVKVNLENASDLVELEIGIRGDPYWMGRPNSLVNQQRSDINLVDYEAGSHSFFLHVNLPNANEDDAGRRKPQPDYQISGLYNVRTVINRFQGGMFTQHLGAIRDLATNVSTVWDQLAGDTTVIDALDSQRRERQRNIAQENEDAQRRANGIGPQ
tara:strand:- start:2785 stop:4776 length:1992 start_codon:yes stop_codon:yes gene_type:complete